MKWCVVLVFVCFVFVWVLFGLDRRPVECCADQGGVVMWRVSYKQSLPPRKAATLASLAAGNRARQAPSSPSPDGDAKGIRIPGYLPLCARWLHLLARPWLHLAICAHMHVRCLRAGQFETHLCAARTAGADGETRKQDCQMSRCKKSERCCSPRKPAK